MNSTQDRYTDTDLIRMLQIVVSDYNRQPTQREVLTDERLPTHHTYRSRFGTLAAALNHAGMGNVPRKKSPTHDAIRECIHASGFKLLGEWVPVGSIIVDFAIEKDGGTVLIDVVELERYVDKAVYDSVIKMRAAIANGHPESGLYILTTGTMDAIKYLAG